MKNSLLLFFLYISLLGFIPLAAQKSDKDEALTHAKELLKSTPIIDGHNDLPWTIRTNKTAPRDVIAYDLRKRTPCDTDIQRLKEGHVGAQFWSVWIPGEIKEQGYAKVQLEQIDITRRMIEHYPEAFLFALSTADIEEAFKKGQIASLLGMEGGHAIENSLGALRAYYRLGVRYMTLTHNVTLDWADAAMDTSAHHGLTAFGKEVVSEMNRLGMLVDLSHVTPDVMMDVSQEVADWEAPLHERLGGITSYDKYEQIREKYAAEFPMPQATIQQVADHIEHARRVAGIDHVGIGSDFFGGGEMPLGLEDTSKFPNLFAELIRRGWSDADLKKLAAENFLRVFREAEIVAAQLRKSRPASTAIIEDLDNKQH
jgi:membrane dipeptidase